MKGQRRSVQAGENFFRYVTVLQVDDSHRPFVGNEADGINRYLRPPPCWSGQIADTRPAPSPVSRVSLVAPQGGFMRPPPDIKHPDQFARECVEFTEPIRQVQHDIKPV